MKNIQKRGFLFLTFMLLLFGSLPAATDDIPARPEPPRLVNDFTGILSAGEVAQLESKLVHFNDTTSTQIVVVLVNSLGEYDKAMFADLLGEKWGVGQKGKNNGIVVLIKPKTAASGGEAFITAGYGLEAVVPDITAKQILEDEMFPYFRENRYFEGIDAGTNILMKLTASEYTADQYMNRKSAKPGTIGFLIPFIILIIVFVKLLGSRRGMRTVAGKSGSSLPFWTALFLANQMGNRHTGKWNDFSSGGGSFGGFGGGGGGSFGGFGGGSFGGGGAGGSW
jgi:uncharacterized protein